MSDIYSNNSKNNDSATVCQTCGADRWPGTDNCPMCGKPYGAKTNVGSGTGTGGYQKKKFEAPNQQQFLSPYERGIYDKDPNSDKKKYGERVVPWRLIIKIVVGVAVLVAVVIIGMRIVNGLVEERVDEENQKEQVYEDLSEERRDTTVSTTKKD